MVKISFEHQEIAVPESWADVRLADICGLDVDVFLSNPTQLFDVVTEMVSFVF